GIIVSFLQTVVTPIYPLLPGILGCTPEEAAWVLSSTLISGAIFTPVSSRLGDMYGKRRVLVVVLLVVVAGCIIAGLSQQLGTLLVGRVLQGVGLGSVPLGI